VIAKSSANFATKEGCSHQIEYVNKIVFTVIVASLRRGLITTNAPLRWSIYSAVRRRNGLLGAGPSMMQERFPLASGLLCARPPGGNCPSTRTRWAAFAASSLGGPIGVFAVSRFCQTVWKLSLLGGRVRRSRTGLYSLALAEPAGDPEDGIAVSALRVTIPSRKRIRSPLPGALVSRPAKRRRNADALRVPFLPVSGPHTSRVTCH
jgi:hypothetical protein